MLALAPEGKLFQTDPPSLNRAPRPILHVRFSILNVRGRHVFAALRFLWNATRGHRFAPWRSPYLRWRVETYSGRRAETLTAKSVLGFVWASRGELFRFLIWTGEMQREARKRV